MPKKRVVPVGGWAAYIKDLAAEAEKHDRDRNELIDSIVQRRLMQATPRLPKELQTTPGAQIRTPFIFDFVRRVAALLGAAPPKPTVRPRNPQSEKALANSTLRERWFDAAHKKMSQDRDVFGEITDALAMGPFAVWKVILKQHRWANITERGEDEDADDYNERVDNHHREHFPFFREHIDSKSFHAVEYDDDGLAETLEITERLATKVFHEYGLAFKRDGTVAKVGQVSDPNLESSSEQKVKVIEHWDRERYHILVDEVIVAEGKHKYGRPPYFVAQATTASLKSATYSSLSLVHPLVSLQDGLDSLLSAQLNWAYVSAHGLLSLRKVDPEAPDVNPKTDSVVLELGKVSIPPPGHEIIAVSLPATGQDLNAMIGIMKGLLEQVSLAPVLYGLSPGADATGVGINTLVAIAKSILGPAARNLARAMSEEAAHIQYCIEKVLREPVPIYHQGQDKWLELGPKDIDGYYQVQFELQPVIPAEQQASYTLYSNALGLKLVPPNLVREKGLGIEAPEEMEVELAARELNNSAPMMQLMTRRLMDRLLESDVNAPPPGTPPTPPQAPGGPGMTQIPGIQQPLPSMAGMPGLMPPSPGPGGGPAPTAGGMPLG